MTVQGATLSVIPAAAKAAQTKETTLEEAAIAYAKAKAEVDGHEGPFRGAAYAAKLAVWRGALLELEEAAKRAAINKGQGT